MPTIALVDDDRNILTSVDWKPDRCRNGCSVRLPKQICR
jgi:hypothetical protein